MVIEIGDNNIKGICKVKDLKSKGLIKASIEDERPINVMEV